MLKATQVIQDVGSEPLTGRYLVLEDDETGARVEVPFERGHLSVLFEGHLFDYYGRSIQIDPKIKRIIKKAGRARAYNSDAESYMVETMNGKTVIAEIWYYTYSKHSQKKDYRGYDAYIYELNPDFSGNNELEVELLCTNIEILDTEIFPEDSYIVQSASGANYFDSITVHKDGSIDATIDGNSIATDNAFVEKKQGVTLYYLPFCLI